MFFRIFLCFLLFGLAQYGLAASADFSRHQLPIDYRLSFDAVNTPGYSKRMGLAGLQILPQWTRYFSAGVGAYAPVSGEQGGYFAWGVVANAKTPEWHRFYLNANGFAGGGGGHSSGFGEGSLLTASLGLMYDFHYFQAGIHYSYFDFPTIHTQSKQVGLSIVVPDTLFYQNPNSLGQTYQSRYFAFSKNYMALLGQLYFQKSGTKNTGGVVQDDTVKLVGLDVGHYFTTHWFGHLKFVGAFSGIPNGYMDVLIGPGYRLDLTHYLALTASLSAGTGGGGAVDTGGGFLWSPEVGLQARWSPHWGAGLSLGYLAAPGGDFKATTLSAQLMYWFNAANLAHHASSKMFSAYEAVWRVRVGNETIFHPKRANSAYDDNVQLVNVGVDRLLNHYFYITGQGASAYSGKQIGGLGVGLLGVGVQTSSLNALQLNGEVLAGAAGGGGLNIGKGAVLQPKLGLSYYLNPYLGLQADVGELFALDNNFHETTLGLNLVLRFAHLEN